jgi:O-antigen/teichoic acid export membrane protein
VATGGAKDDVARAAGRGFVAILAAKLYFLVAGYAIVVTLSWVLGRSLYGVYGLVVGAISVLDNVIVTGTIQAVSRFTAEGGSDAGAVKAAGLRMQVALGGAAALVFAAVAPAIAAFERDPGLTPYLRLAAAVVLCYAFYSVFVGSANGQRRFGAQAGLDALYATLRGALIVGLAAAGWAVWGALAGFVAASAVIVAVAATVVGVRDLRGGFSSWKLARFALPVMAYLLVVNLAMFADLFLLKRLAADAPGADLEAVNSLTGSYVAVQQLARICYQALLAVTFVVFPLVSRSTFVNDDAATRAYVATTMRYALILAVTVAVAFVALPGRVLAVPFPREYHVGATALAVLTAGYVGFSLFVVATTILNAAGRLGLSLAVTAAMLAVEVAVSWALLARAATEEARLVAAAAGAAAGMGVGWLAASLALRRCFGAAEPWRTLLRVPAAAAGAALLGRALPAGSRATTVVECVVVVVAFVAGLVVLGELGRDDARRVVAVLRPGAARRTAM